MSLIIPTMSPLNVIDTEHYLIKILNIISHLSTVLEAALDEKFFL